VDSVEELLQSGGERLTNDWILELAEQRTQSTFTDSDAEDEHQRESFLQNSSAAALSRTCKSWTSLQITTLTTSRALMQSEVFLNLHPVRENYFVREYSRQDSQLLTPRFAKNPKPSSIRGAVIFIKKVFISFLCSIKFHCTVIFVRATKILRKISP
jgi:hypothetical protein